MDAMILDEAARARFWQKVDKNGPGGCWIWTGALYWDGYGAVTLVKANGNRTTARAHRLSYEMMVGPIPDKYVVDHVVARGCHNRNCVNPAHLEAVTKRENTIRGNTVIAAHVAATHCPKGHPYEGANLYVHPTTGARGCRACNAESARRQRAKRKTQPQQP